MSKIVSLSDLEQLVDSWKKSGKKIVFTWGGFDGLNENHIKFLQKAKESEDVLVVGVSSDYLARFSNPNAPKMKDINDRIKTVSNVSDVDHVIALSGPPVLTTVLNHIEGVEACIVISSHDQKDKITSIKTKMVAVEA